MLGGLRALVALQLLALCATWIARRWSRSWVRPRKLFWLLLYHAAVGAAAGWLFARSTGLPP